MQQNSFPLLSCVSSWFRFTPDGLGGEAVANFLAAHRQGANDENVSKVYGMCINNVLPIS